VTVTDDTLLATLRHLAQLGEQLQMTAVAIATPRSRRDRQRWADTVIAQLREIKVIAEELVAQLSGG
jgi:hypothetical protein